MPLDLQIIRASEFVRLGPRHRMNYDESQSALRELARACCKRGVDRALLDLREIPIAPKPAFSPSELAALVETFHEAGFGENQRLAVLYKTDPHHGVRLFAFIGTMRGWQVQAFDDFEKALLWLSENRGQQHEPGEQDIPVRVSRRKAEVRSGNDRPVRNRVL